MDLQAIQTYLTRIRTEGDAQMRPCGLITEELRSIPAQRVGIAHLFLRPRFLLADPTGAGKTPQALAAFGYLKEKDPRLRLLVLTTKSAQFQWKTAVERFLRGVSAEVIGYTDRKQKIGPTARVDRYRELTADVWITTYATLALDEAPLLYHLDHYVLALDEVHGIKNWHTLKKTEGRSLFASALHASEKARSVWGLSATPVKNDRLDELFSVMEVVRPGTFGDPAIDIRQRWSQYRRHYYILKLVKPRWKAKPGKPAPKPFYEVIGTQNLDELRQVIDPFYLRRPKDMFDAHLPPLTFRQEDVFLDPRQRKLYEEIWAQKWPGKHGSKMLKIAAITRAQQALAAPELVGHPKVPNAKWEVLKGLLQGELRGEKVLVYSKFAEVVHILSRELTTVGILHTHITGSDSAPQREIARQRFQTDPRVPVMLVTDAGGEALDLQAAGFVVLYDLPWSWGSFQQIVGRAHRLGSVHSNVLVILLGAADSLDESIKAILIRKETMIRELLSQGTQNTDTLISTATTTATATAPDTITETATAALISVLEGAPVAPSV